MVTIATDLHLPITIQLKRMSLKYCETEKNIYLYVYASSFTHFNNY